MVHNIVIMLIIVEMFMINIFKILFPTFDGNHQTDSNQKESS